MARSRNKYARARMRAKVRRPKRRGGARWYYGALACIVIAGIAGITLSAGASDKVPLAGLDPATGDFYDHWHEALGVNICGEWLDETNGGFAPEFHEVDGTQVQAGLHTHGDGFIHIHPYTAADSGDNATLGRFLRNGGWDVTESSFTVWSGPSTQPTKTTWSNGDACPEGSEMAGRKGEVKWSIDCVSRTGNPGDYKLEDLQVVAIAFLPKDEKVGVPTNAFATPDADSASDPDPKALNVETCGTAGPGGTTSTSTSTVPSTEPTTTTSVATTP